MIKISQLQLENVKKIKAVTFEPNENGLTIIGGNNGEGKTSVLDSIAWALGGDRFRPSTAMREGSTIPPMLKIELSNGLIVERKGENSSLKVWDPAGVKAGQQLLNVFIEALALDLPKFLEENNKEKAKTLLKIIGVEEELNRLEAEEDKLYNQRRTIGQIASQKQKFANEMPFYPGIPKEPVSAFDLIKQQQDILARNGEKERLKSESERLHSECEKQDGIIADLQTRLQYELSKKAELQSKYEASIKSPEELELESTAEIEESLQNIEAINIKIRSNLEREKAEIDAEQYNKQYTELTEEIEEIRKAKLDLLSGAELPLEGLSVEDGELTYKGFKWDNMSSSEQLKVATAIVRKLNPKCGFVLIDKLEQMDINTLTEFGKWLEQEGLQAIATRVSTGDECSIIIEDGTAVNTNKKWTKGVF